MVRYHSDMWWRPCNALMHCMKRAQQHYNLFAMNYEQQFNMTLQNSSDVETRLYQKAILRYIKHKLIIYTPAWCCNSLVLARRGHVFYCLFESERYRRYTHTWSSSSGREGHMLLCNVWGSSLAGPMIQINIFHIALAQLRTCVTWRPLALMESIAAVVDTRGRRWFIGIHWHGIRMDLVMFLYQMYMCRLS